MKLQSDISRCKGDASYCCTDCARRLQIALDDASRWFPYMFQVPVRNRCEFKIVQGKKDGGL